MIHLFRFKYNNNIWIFYDFKGFYVDGILKRKGREKEKNLLKAMKCEA